MQNLPDEACVEELGYLFFFSPTLFLVKSSEALLDRLDVGLDPQGMLGDFSQDS
jgi:hypothetical protein